MAVAAAAATPPLPTAPPKRDVCGGDGAIGDSAAGGVAVVEASSFPCGKRTRASLPLRRLWVAERRGGNDPLMVTLAIVGGGGATADSDGGARCCRQ